MKANTRQVGGQHYNPGSAIQHWDWAVANNLGYLEGVLTKYVCRHKTSGKPDDLKKALHYAEKLAEVRGNTAPWIGNRTAEVELMPELIAAYKLSAEEAEICRLAARYNGREDLDRLITALHQI